MSLVRAALRLAAYNAVYGRTEVGTEVHDSEMGAIQSVLDGKVRSAPLIVVYTDEGNETDVSDGLLAAGEVSIVFEIAVQAVEQSPDDPNALAAVVPVTDPQMELLLDLIERQVLIALNDTSNPWREVLDGFIFAWRRRRTIRATGSQTARFAARQLTLDVEPIREPTPAGAVTGAWADLIAALEADGGTLLAGQAQVFRRALDPETPLVEWEELAMRYGLSAATAATLGIGPAGDEEATIDEFVGTEARQGDAP